MIPGQLQATVESGYLLGNMHLKQIYYHNEKTTIKASDLQFSWYIKNFHPIIIALPHVNLSDFIVEYPTAHEPVYGFAHASLNGQLALNDISMRADNADRQSISASKKTHFTLAWQKMIIPINPSFNITFPVGKLIFDGPLMNYHVHGKFISAGNNFPHAKWQINKATGNFEKINITSLTGTPLDGKALLTGQVTWLPDVKWDAHLTGQHINTAMTWPTPQSDVDIHIHSQGLMTKTESQYRFELKKLTGTAENYPIKGTGNILISNDNYEFQQLLLQIGAANLHANGTLTPQSANLIWQLHIPVLGDLLKDAKGSINGEGSIIGSLQKPHIKTNLTVDNAAWRGLIAKRIIAQVDGYSNLNDASNINISIIDLFTGNLQVNTAQLQFQNKQKQNQLTIDLKGPRSQFSFQANGKLVSQQWQGQIGKLTLDMHNIGAIKLNSPANLTLTQHSFAFQPFCLQAVFGQTCIQQANFAINSPLLPTKNKIAKKVLKAADRTLTGALQLSSHDLAFISVFWPQISNVRGEFNANFRISGTTVDPVLNGQADLTNSSLSIPRLGINLSNIMAHIAGNQSNLTYKAQARFGNGMLNIDGATDLAKKGFQSNITIRGNDLLVMNTSDAEVYASPNLELDWLTPLLKINGIITIPSAKITPRDLTSTITLPNDVVFVTPDERTEQQNTHIYSHVQIILGDNIKFDYSGLNGNITGAVTVEDKPGGDTTGSGTLSIVNATYKAYGQNLGIRQGKLIFTGGPINNPGLNIQAVKQLQVVTTSTGPQANSSAKSSLGDYSSNQQTVGINISGTLSEPSAVLFSEPPGLSQSDILSYLITGRPASQATQQDSMNILSALSLLNLSGSSSSQIKNQFSSALGLSEFSISHEQEYDKQQNSVVENTSLLLGKALSPRLLVNYSLGLVEPINTLKIVYKIQKNLSLQSEHSTNANGVDLYYTIERD
jgi:translocation and assembly module TamB